MSVSESPRDAERLFRKLLPRLSSAQSEALLDSFGDLEVVQAKAPRCGLVMVTAKDSFDELFHLGEALASVAEIECCGVKGCATVLGDDPGKAVLAALVDACCRSSGAEKLLAPFKKALGDCARSVEAELAAEARTLAATKASFERMAPEKA